MLRWRNGCRERSRMKNLKGLNGMDGKDTINQILKEMSATDAPITGKEDLLLDLGLDSLRIVEVIVEIEKAFDFEFSESDLNPDLLQSVRDLYKLVGV